MALWQLIAQEYRKYVLTRGFLLFLLIIPVSALFGVAAGYLNAVSQPVRAFTVIDQTGRYGAEIDQVIENRRVRREIETWDAYVTGLEAVRDREFDLPEAFRPTEDDLTLDRRAAFAEAGGIEAANAAIAEQLPPGTPPAEAPRHTLRRIEPPADVPLSGDLAAAAAALRPYLNGERQLPANEAEDASQLFAALLIPADFDADGEDAQFWTTNLADVDLREALREALTSALKRSAYAEQGLPADAVAEIEMIDAPLATYKSDSEGDEEAGFAEFAALYIPLALAYLLLVMIMSVGGMLLTSTVEEKSNKIVEVLLSSVSAGELMAGKLIGLALVGVTAPVLFLLAGFAGLTLFGGADEAVVAIRDVLFGSPLVPLFFFYFVVGYVMFASLYLAVGAMSSSIQDAQSFVGPMTIVLILPLPFLQQVVQDPNGLVARILTWIPIYTPYAVMMRINQGLPLWELLGATLLLVAFTGVILFFMGRIYRNGVLSSGGAPKLKDAVRLASTSA
ncbi:ABC transporter permease [Parvularcula dongshanensis]|uniref:ABC-2 type transport system permease protein n=1 Tax=Parvularcula dongshanensis TaxID=1173995 RepID=A0A840I6G9_9PROT|nr:ABC transporter permease [Parvularcula dongshanensis]MBB4659728.1 ABC-2 type transport system permease protein [Parvularcula dongshanensis]